MTHLPSISTVLPVYNAAATLPAAVASILKQSEGDHELIIVDDGSTDGGIAALPPALRDDSRLRLVRREHGGIVAALNAGIEASRGRYIARMDADDISYPDRFRQQKEWLDTRPGTGLVACQVDYGGDRETQTGYGIFVDWTNAQTSAEEISRGRFIESPLAHPSVMFRRELVEQHGGYRDGPFPEDYELWLRWLDAGVRMEKTPTPLLRWNDPPERLSRQDGRYSSAAFFQCKAKYLARWLARTNPCHPRLHVWGASRIARRRAAYLEAEGIEIVAYIDIDPKKIGQQLRGRPVISAEEIADPGEWFVASYVASRGARLAISAALEARGYVNGRDFVIAA